MSTIIKLNVGGQLFTTTEDTLSSDGGYHMLASMAKHGSNKIDGGVFIDRDPTVFHWILNYLRGSKVLPELYIETDVENVEYSLLCEEAEFYTLENLVIRLKHMKSPVFKKQENVVVNRIKYTIVDHSKDAYLVTRGGQTFKLPPTNEIETTTVEIGDEVMAWHAGQHGRRPGICMAIENKGYTIQFKQSTQCLCNKTGVRF